MMCVEVTVVPQCRLGLAPTRRGGRRVVSGGDRHHRATFRAVGGDDRVPGSAGGDDGVSCRRVAAAITAWAWVTVSLICSQVVRWLNPAA